MDIDGKKLTAAREAAGLSKNQLAGASFVSRSYITQLEADTANNPSEGKIKSLADALKITPKDLAPDPAEGETLSTQGGRKYQVRIVGGRRKLIEV